MSLKPPENKLEKLQAALRSKAKAFPNYRFYLLYDKVYRADVLAEAYRCCRRNDGAPGVDGQTFRDIETYGRDRWLGELAEELRKKTYQPQAVLRRWIPKADGKQRPLGIPTIRGESSERHATRMKDEAPRKGAWPLRCWPTCTCGDSYSGGKLWVTKNNSMHGWSTTQTTS